MVRYQLLWPVGLITICLVGLCLVTAVSLFQEQAMIAHVLRENVASRKAAVELEECLAGLIDLEANKVEQVTALHRRVQTHLDDIHKHANQPEEQEIAARLSAGFVSYLNRWQSLPPPGHPDHEIAVREATRFLETHVLRPSQEFRLYNGREIEETTEHHERVLRQLAWGMAGVGGLGAIAGMVLGYGVARGVSQSIRRLQVRIRDAAGKLGPALPEILVSGEGDFRGLNEQVDGLMTRIERVLQELHNRELEVLRAEQLAGVGQLAAGVGHEIRNPLTSIKLLIQTAIEDPESGGLSPEDLRVIESEVRKMERSLQTFLNFARPARPERRPTDILATVQTVLGLIRGRAEKQRVTVELNSPADDITLVFDPIQIQQVMVNLLLNALDAMPGGGKLKVDIRRTAVGGIAIEVTDTGPGIPEEMLSRLFRPFVSGKETGLGLGLVISQRIVHDHGGTISAANRPGGGAMFTIFLPPA